VEGGRTLVGQGRWYVNQVIGASLQEFSFPEAPEQNLHITIRENFRYEAEQSQNGACFGVPQRTMETQFVWARTAKYMGIKTINNVEMDVWEGKSESGHQLLTLTMARNQNTPMPKPHSLRTVDVATGRQLTITFTAFTYELIEDLEFYQRPAGCPVLVDQVEEEDTEVRYLNVTTQSLDQILKQAAAICNCGCPYVYGGNGPCCPGHSGYDCSGLTTKSYAAGGVAIPRTASAQQRSGKPCAGGEKAGDLLFMGNPAYHVVMHYGGNQWAECPRTGLNCRITSPRGHDGGCRRIL